MTVTSLMAATETGRSVFNHREFLASVSNAAGVYRMLNIAGDVIYVGKARHLRKRLSSYFNKAHDTKTLALIGQIASIETTVTHTEGEALLLEDTLIKKLQPRYNVLLRDDKSYPYIYLSTQDDFPRLALYRGPTKSRKGTFFGPFPSSGAVRQSIHLLHRIFRLRQCTDSYFRNRSRPCLQYQIKRCSGPCIGLISKQDYARDIEHTRLFLNGKTSRVIEVLVAKMGQASENLEFEQAALYRDQISHLRQILEKQYVSGKQRVSADVIAGVVQGGQACVQVFYYREGNSHGNKVFYPRLPPADLHAADVLEAFITQYYLAHDLPRELIVSHAIPSAELLMNVLSERRGSRVVIKSNVRGGRAHWLETARQNAREALSARLASRSSQQQRLENLRQLLGLDCIPQRMECFDISHTQGKQTVASCVVFDANGAVKSDYRRFNITGITPGDDCAAMAQVLERRYSRVLKEEGQVPDIIFIDGGKAQLGTAITTMQALFPDGPVLVGVSKGPDRKPGMEQLHLVDAGHPLEPGPQSPALLLIQQIRDEAHRFAISGHRQRARKTITHSILEDIEGLGAKRRQALITHFGGLHGVKRAGIEDLEQIRGISRSLAQKIYEYLHTGQT